MLGDVILAAAFLFILFDGHKWAAQKYVDTVRAIRNHQNQTL